MVRDLAWTALWLAFSTSLVSAATAAAINVTAPIVDLGYAQYQGYFDAQTNITSFLSVRYAAPPIGECNIELSSIVTAVHVAMLIYIIYTGNLRFQAPQPPVPESGVQPATQNPGMCYQATIGENMTAPVSPYGHNKRQSTTPAASEDCLFLK